MLRTGVECNVIEVRDALPEDLPHLRRMALDFHQASCYRDVVPANLDDFEATLGDSLAAGSAIALVAVVNGEVHGMAAALVMPHWFNRRALVANELFWWVDPAARACGAGVQLLDTLESRARSAGCHVLHIASTANLRPAALARLYRMRGYVPQDVYFAKVLNPCPLPSSAQ